MALSVAMDTALAGMVVTTFTSVEIVLPGSTIRLINSAGSVTYSSKTFTGRDSIYGALSYVESVAESASPEAPRVRIGLLPPSNAAIVALAAPAVQGSIVTIQFGLVNEATGAVIGTPETLFAGEVDTAQLVSNTNTRTLELDCVSILERLFTDTEGIHLNGAWHKSVYPGELGMDFVIEALDDPYWGSDGPKPATTTTYQPGGGGGWEGGDWNLN